jgi:hypothetical protein
MGRTGWGLVGGPILALDNALEDYATLFGFLDAFDVIPEWLPPRDSNPDNLLQRQVSYH